MTNIRQTLLAAADAYCARRGISKHRLATLVVNDGKFFDRVERQGRGFTVATYEKFMAYFAANPVD